MVVVLLEPAIPKGALARFRARKNAPGVESDEPGKVTAMMMSAKSAMKQ